MCFAYLKRALKLDFNIITHVPKIKRVKQRRCDFAKKKKNIELFHEFFQEYCLHKYKDFFFIVQCLPNYIVSNCLLT